MKKAAIALAAAVCAVAVPVAAAGWVIPATQTVGFSYTGGEYISVSFNANNADENYSQLAPQEERVALSVAESYIPSAEECSIYDFDAEKAYVFDGWYTLPEGGERVGGEVTLLKAADGRESITLYAHWQQKSALKITIKDNCYSGVDGSCTLFWQDGQNEWNSALCASAEAGTFDFIYYINPAQKWKIISHLASGDRELSGVSLSEGRTYSFSITVYATGIISASSSLKDIT